MIQFQSRSMSDPTLSDILITLKTLLLQGHPVAFLSSRNNWHSIRDKPHRDLVSKHFLQMFFHPDQVNQKHFRDQHLELSDSPTSEEVYNLIYWIFMVFKIVYLIFSSIVSSPRNNDFFLSTIVPPQFDTTAQSSKISNLIPVPLYFKGNCHIFR